MSRGRCGRDIARLRRLAAVVAAIFLFETPETVFETVSGTFWIPGSEGPGRLFGDSFGIPGPEGPGDSCKGRPGLQGKSFRKMPRACEQLGVTSRWPMCASGRSTMPTRHWVSICMLQRSSQSSHSLHQPHHFSGVARVRLADLNGPK